MKAVMEELILVVPKLKMIAPQIAADSNQNKLKNVTHDG